MIDRQPFVLIILDGWGIAPAGPGNAIALAHKPTYDALIQRYPATTLTASGDAVGLLPNEAGNSEAGHMNLGGGRVVKQQVRIISDAISDGSFFKNPVFTSLIHRATAGTGRIHLMGLLSSDQSPHSHPAHFAALRRLCSDAGVSVFLHLFTDGRDSSPHAGADFLQALDLYPSERVATICGRAYAMDRKNDWSRTSAAYDALVEGRGASADSAAAAIAAAYARGETDEFIMPTVVNPDGCVQDGDGVIFFNFRPDRARQLTKAFVQPDFEERNRPAFVRRQLKNLAFVTLTDYGPELTNVSVGYPEITVAESLPFALQLLRQCYIGESEKFAHVTYFFNGGHVGSVAGEERIRIPSPDVLHYDAAPDMAAGEITDAILAAIATGKTEFIVANYANADMLGHTENIAAAVRGVECIDRCLGRIVSATLKKHGTVFITADHGNAEVMLTPDGQPYTEHTTSPVPFIVVNEQLRASRQSLRPGILADVAPTILELLRLPKPQGMTGTSLIG